MITYNAIVHACVVIVQFSLCMDVDAVTKEALDLMGDLKEARQTGSQHELTISTLDTKLAQQQKFAEAAHYQILKLEEELKSSRNDSGIYEYN